MGSKKIAPTCQSTAMAKRSVASACLVVMGALLGCNILTSTFVPPARPTAGAAPAFADEIGDAAKKLASASYPFIKDIDWNSGLALTNPGKASAADWTKAIAKAIDMGAAMDSNLLKAGVYAHHVAIQDMDTRTLVTPEEDYERVVAALGRMI